MTRSKSNVLVRQTDFEYLLNLLEREVLATPTNRALHDLGEEAAPFRSDYFPETGVDFLKVEPQILHEMLYVREQE